MHNYFLGLTMPAVASRKYPPAPVPRAGQNPGVIWTESYPRYRQVMSGQRIPDKAPCSSGDDSDHSVLGICGSTSRGEEGTIM